MFDIMKRIAISRERLATSIRIWIRLAPKRIWRKSEDYERLVEAKRHDPKDAPDPHGELADYLAERFGRADWEITHPDPRSHQ